LLAAASGFVNILIFPKPELTLLSWVTLVPLLLATYKESRAGRAFLLGALSGTLFFFGSCRWIIYVLKNYGDLGWFGSILAFLMLVVYLSFYYASFGLVFAWLSWRFPQGCFFLAPAVWVSCEYLRGHLLTGFPWCLLGYALVDYPNLAKISTLTGVYGLSFALALINALVASVVLARDRESLLRLILAVLLLATISGLFVLNPSVPAQPVYPACIVQTNLSPDQRWDLESRTVVFKELAQLSLSPLSKNKDWPSAATRLIIWPETPAPFYFNHDALFHRQMQLLAQESRSYVVFGFVDYKSPSSDLVRRDPYNSVGLLSPQGDLISQYDKIHLVPFGEYVPYPGIFFFIEKISTEAGNFKPGNQFLVSPLDGKHTIGGFVCYEAIFPELVRQFAKQGAAVLFNVTNDAWFGDSAAPYQHLNMARLRAIENQRYLLRAANNGISALVDPDGKIVNRTRLNERIALEAYFDFRSQQTIYTRIGDWFAWLCLLTTMSAGGYLIIKRMRRTLGAEVLLGYQQPRA
jgi:apolipoprotein N-acyltransferase